MASKWTELCIDCADPEKLARFWSAVLDYEEGERRDEYIQIQSRDRALPTLLFIRVPDDKIVKNRLHIDVNATDRDQEQELERLLELGARKIDIGQGDVSWVVLADPEGNEFCLLSSRVD